eukprot:364348-Chlamydomonas_euryale.AAC.3
MDAAGPWFRALDPECFAGVPCPPPLCAHAHAHSFNACPPTLALRTWALLDLHACLLHCCMRAPPSRVAFQPEKLLYSIVNGVRGQSTPNSAACCKPRCAHTPPTSPHATPLSSPWWVRAGVHGSVAATKVFRFGAGKRSVAQNQGVLVRGREEVGCADPREEVGCADPRRFGSGQGRGRLRRRRWHVAWQRRRGPARRCTVLIMDTAQRACSANNGLGAVLLCPRRCAPAILIVPTALPSCSADNSRDLALVLC